MLYRVVLYSAFLFGFLLPMSTNYSNIAIILFYIASVIFVVSTKQNNFSRKQTFLLGSSILLIVPSCVNLIFTGFENSVMNIFVRRITFLLSPLIIVLLPRILIGKLRNKALLGLICGCVISSLFLIFKNFERYFMSKGSFVIDKELFNYYHTHVNFMSSIDIHPSYYGMYVLLALYALYFLNIFKKRYIKAVIFMLFGLTVLFLNSRIIIFLSLLFLLWILFNEVKNIFQRKKAILLFAIGGFLIVTLLFVGLKNTYLFQKFSKELVWDLSNQVGTKYNSKNKGDSRVARWQVATSLIKERPFFGYGVDSETLILEEKYLEYGMKTSANFKYNAHNQFLTTAIEGGVLSLLFVLGFFIYNIRLSWKANDLLSLFFILSIITVCIVESFLKRNAGITLVAFFGSLFLFYNVPIDEKK